VPVGSHANRHEKVGLRFVKKAGEPFAAIEAKHAGVWILGTACRAEN
jgi:hypothetical protein